MDNIDFDDFDEEEKYDGYIDFSNIDSEIKSYIIGFLYADGHISDYTISVRLSINDEEHLKILSKIFNKEIFYRDIKNKNGKTYKSVGFNYCNKKTIDTLRKIGFVKRKTYQIDDVVFRNIPYQFKKDFIRGFYDGDGTIFFSKWTRNSNWKTSERCSVGFVSYNSVLLNSIKDFLQEELDLPIGKRIRSDRFKDDESKNNKYWRLIYNGNKISKKIMDYLYGDATIYMNRKYDKYLKIKVHKIKGYTYSKTRDRWIFKYMDGDILRKKSFKTEEDGINFLKEIKK